VSRDAVVGAVRYCCRPDHLRRTTRIALVVGVVLTLINQLDVILEGDATELTGVKAGMNFLVPFVVSNLGLLSGRSSSHAGATQPGVATPDRAN
jgi:hypothetical protein